MFNNHDEWNSLLLLVVIIFIIIISFTIIIGYNMKPDRTKVKTLISTHFVS